MHPDDRRLWELLERRQDGGTGWDAYTAAREAYRVRLAEMAAEHRAAMLLGRHEPAQEPEAA